MHKRRGVASGCWVLSCDYTLACLKRISRLVGRRHIEHRKWIWVFRDGDKGCWWSGDGRKSILSHRLEKLLN